MREIYVNATVDMRDIPTRDLISELGYRELSTSHIESLKQLVDCNFTSKTLDEAMKLEVITANLNNKSYLEICSFFEGPLPFEK